MSHYAQLIEEVLAASGRSSTVSTRHVEAWMRCEHPTLDALSPRQFKHEVAVAYDCAVADFNTSERLAQSYGL